MPYLRILLLTMTIVRLLTLPATSASPVIEALLSVEVLAFNVTETDQPKGSETPMPTRAAYEPGVLLATVSTQEEAQRIADLYGITLESVNGTLAKFTTDQDILGMITLGRENGWPTLTPDYHNQLFLP